MLLLRILQFKKCGKKNRRESWEAGNGGAKGEMRGQKHALLLHFLLLYGFAGHLEVMLMLREVERGIGFYEWVCVFWVFCKR